MDSLTPNERVDALLSLKKVAASVPDCKLTKGTGFKFFVITFKTLIKSNRTYTYKKRTNIKLQKLIICCIKISAS